MIWNIGPLATGAAPVQLLRLWWLVRKLKKLPVGDVRASPVTAQ